jgi:DNA-binding NarL/FixJ family response regulator
MDAISVIVADDHHLVREGLAVLLRGQPGIRVVGEADDGEALLERIAALAPDVAIVDVAMPRMTGIEVARKVRDAGQRTAVVLVSIHDEPSFVRAGLEAGASAYILKASGPEELLAAIRAAAEGDMYLSPKVTAKALGALGPRGGADTLTVRERDVLRLLARGLSSKEMASCLGIGARTVDTHRASLMEKLGIHHVPGLVKYAIRSHLASLEE